jgi:hypothetical protein
MDAIGDAFGNLSVQAGGPRGGQPQQQQQQQQQPSSFDFLQSTVKQQLPPAAPNNSSSNSRASPMSNGMGMGSYQQQQYSSQR